MTERHAYLTDAQLDAALDTLTPPPLSAVLERRARGLAPQPNASLWTRWAPRLAVAASLVLALGGTAWLQMNQINTTAAPASAAPVAQAADGSTDEIIPRDLALVDEPVQRVAETEPFSVAVMPLE